MLNRGVLVGLLLLGSGALSLVHAESSPLPAIAEGNHSVLVRYWSDQAKEMREQAKRYDELAEAYVKSQKPGGAVHAAHCKDIANYFRQAADGAEVIAHSHHSQLP